MRRIVMHLAVLTMYFLVAGGLYGCGPKTSNDHAGSRNAVTSASANNHGQRNGFPSKDKLGSIGNLVDKQTGPIADTIEHVHARDNWKKLTKVGGGVVELLYKGKIYKEMKAFGGKDSYPAEQGETEANYFRWVGNIDDLFKDRDMVAHKVGRCSVAGKNGNKWEIKQGTTMGKAIARSFIRIEYTVCTAAGGGYLLSAHLLAAGAEATKDNGGQMKRSIQVLSIGQVPVLMPKEL